MTITTTTERWITTDDLMRQLHISRAHLQQLRHRGVLQPGDHWVRTGGGRAPIIWDLERVTDALREMTRANEGETYSDEAAVLSNNGTTWYRAQLQEQV